MRADVRMCKSKLQGISMSAPDHLALPTALNPAYGTGNFTENPGLDLQMSDSLYRLSLAYLSAISC